MKKRRRGRAKKQSEIENENKILALLKEGPKDAYEMARAASLSPAGVKKIARRLCRRVGVTKVADSRGQVRKNQYYLMIASPRPAGRGKDKEKLVVELESLIVEKVEVRRQLADVEKRLTEIRKKLSA